MITFQNNSFITGKFKTSELKPRKNDYANPCISYVKDYQVIAVIGGKSRENSLQKTVELYYLD